MNQNAACPSPMNGIIIGAAMGGGYLGAVGAKFGAKISEHIGGPMVTWLAPLVGTAIASSLFAFALIALLRRRSNLPRHSGNR
jgi:hypothetical protein